MFEAESKIIVNAVQISVKKAVFEAGINHIWKIG
jgi:hypothetical protein